MPDMDDLADDIAPAAAEAACFDPCRPVPATAVRKGEKRIASRQNQRQRRSQILATIRRLLVEHGCAGVTMRRIAEQSGHAVQTIYNLAGPRDQAIIEAISEYTRYVGQTAAHDPADANAVVRIIDQWVESIAARPEFCRQVSLIFFTESRGIFYAIRDRQMKGLYGLLLRQQKSGVLRADANVRELAEQLAFCASALCIEWADRPFPPDELRRRLCANYANLLASAIAPGAGRVRLVA